MIYAYIHCVLQALWSALLHVTGLLPLSKWLHTGRNECLGKVCLAELGCASRCDATDLCHSVTNIAMETC